MKWSSLILLVAIFSLGYSCAELTPPPGYPPASVPDSHEMPAAETAAELTITIVYDNNEYDKRLEAKWGFSCLIEGLKRIVLFDTGGDSATLLHNMRELEINPQDIDAVMLSHIHADHVGGLDGFLEENSNVIVYLPQSFPQSFKDTVSSLGAKVNAVSEARELFTGVYTTGELGDGVKEQSLILTTSRGLVIITGCAHPGVVNIVRKARDAVPEDRVYLVMGGFHLAGASISQIESVIEGFRRSDVKRVAPCHCSGDETRRLFRERCGEDYIDSGVGKRITIP